MADKIFTEQDNGQLSFIPSATDNIITVPAYKGQIYAKSNFLVSAKYQMSLFEAKITAMSIAQIQDADEEPDGSLVCRFKTAELARLFKDTSGHFYNCLSEECSKIMSMGRSIAIFDPENNYFSYVMFITKMEYNNGVLTIEFHKDIKPLVRNLSKHFTKFELGTMMSFKSIYSFKLYEILKSKRYASSTIKYSLSELMVDFGMVDPALKSMKKYINGKKDPDYEKAVEEASDVKFKVWGDFRRHVLDNAIAEINEKTELYVTYEAVRVGKGGKVKYIVFTINEKNTITSKASIKPEVEDMEENTYDKARALLEKEWFSDKNVQAIVKAADGDMEKIKTAHAVFLETGAIENPSGWMIAAIKDKYKKSPNKSPRARRNSFHNFTERQCDWNAMAEEIMKKQEEERKERENSSLNATKAVNS